MTKIDETKSPKEGKDEFDRKIEEFFTKEELDFSYMETEEWKAERQKFIDEEKKEQEWRDRNRYFPFANLKRLIDYPNPDVEGAYKMRKKRHEEWAEMHEEMSDYDGGYEAYLEYGNDDMWSDDVDGLCIELADYKYHWLIGRMIQIRESYYRFRLVKRSYGGGFAGFKRAFQEVFLGRLDCVTERKSHAPWNSIQ